MPEFITGFVISFLVVFAIQHWRYRLERRRCEQRMAERIRKMDIILEESDQLLANARADWERDHQSKES